MRGNRSTGTKPETELRKELHQRGLRFRKHTNPVQGLRCRPDIVFPKARIAVECRGCFWHLCREHAVLPKSNLDYWLPKLEVNVARDRRNEAAFAEADWTLIVVWEHDDLIAVADYIEAAVKDARDMGVSNPRRGVRGLRPGFSGRVTDMLEAQIAEIDSESNQLLRALAALNGD